MQQTFETNGPTALYVEIGSGTLEVRTTESATATDIDVRGGLADEVTVEQRGDQVVVIGPHRGGFGGRKDLRVTVTASSGSSLSTKVGSADVNVVGTLGLCQLRSGSGDVTLDRVTGEAAVETGSGDLRIRSVAGDLRVRTGSGDVTVDTVEGGTTINTGSGDVQIGTAAGEVQVKTASGDLRVREAGRDVALNSASGDLIVDLVRRGQLAAHNVSGDIRVGVPGGVPVWTDISTVSGSVRSTLEGAGEPAEGQEFVELRAKTVSGDVYLEQR